MVPNKPPPGVKLFDEEIEEVEESDEDDEDMEPAPIPSSSSHIPPSSSTQDYSTQDVEMAAPVQSLPEDGSEAEEEDGLFAGGDEEEEESGDDAMDVSTAAADASNGVKRKLVEEDDYD